MISLTHGNHAKNSSGVVICLFGRVSVLQRVFSKIGRRLFTHTATLVLDELNMYAATSIVGYVLRNMRIKNNFFEGSLIFPILHHQYVLVRPFLLRADSITSFVKIGRRSVNSSGLIPVRA